MNDAWKTRLGQVVVEREYQLKHGRKRTKVYVRFGKPRPIPNARGPDYYCVYRIEGLGEDWTTCLYGIDSFQALHQAINIALVELICSSAYQEGRLTWEGLFDLGLGYPTPEAVKDRVKKDPNLDHLGPRRKPVP